MFGRSLKILKVSPEPKEFAQLYYSSIQTCTDILLLMNISLAGSTVAYFPQLRELFIEFWSLQSNICSIYVNYWSNGRGIWLVNQILAENV